MTDSVFSNHRSTIKNLLFLVLVSLLLSGCAQLIRTEQPKFVDWAALSAGHTIGQTFVAKYDGLTGIYFYLSPQKKGNGEIRLHLRSTLQTADDLAVSLNTLAVEAIKATGYYGFFVPAQASSSQEYYYVFLELTGNGDIQVGKAAGDSYLNGALYQNGMPEDAQAAFQLSYSRRNAILGLGWEAISLAGILVVGLFLFILPGWGLFSLLWFGWGGLRWPEKLGLSAGLSLALYPLLLLWTDIIGLHLGAIYAWLPPIIGLGIILWRNRKRLNVRAFLHFNGLMLSWADVTFIGLMALIISTRFWAIRSLDVPMWGDSYQHTMIAQLLVDHGGLFTSWQPYAELTTFTYHFGFHSAVAVFDWITRMDMPKAVLWVGQLVNLLAVIVLYPLATKIGRGQWAGVVAILVAGLLSPMPMYYVNWGRYTQLAGQVILPVVAWVMFSSLANGLYPKGKRETIGMVIIGCVTFGGLALTHYRVLILAVIFLLILWILYARRKTFWLMLQRTFWVGVGGGLLFLPWFIRVFSGKILQIFAHQMATSATQAVEANPQLTNIGNISTYLPFFLWLVLVVVICFGLWRREKGILLISLWWFGNLLAGNPSWVGLPGAGAVTGFAVIIAAYIPAGILIGAATSWLDLRKIIASSSQPTIRKAFSLAVIILIIGIGVWGVRQRLKDVHPSNTLVTRPDILAAKWLQENTAPEASILVNSFFAYNNSVIVGSDGGWWLPILARRQITVPPINYSSEQNTWPGYLDQTNALTFEIRAKGIQNPVVLTELKDRGISYAYIGQLQGLVNSGGPLFTAGQMLSDSNFRLVYHQDRVWIFQIQHMP
jgi:hypothetical protein